MLQLFTTTTSTSWKSEGLGITIFSIMPIVIEKRF